MDQKPSFGTEAYGAAATFGRVYSIIGAIIGVIIMIILIIAGVSKLRDPHTVPVSATVASVSSCTKESTNNDTMFHCLVGACGQ